MTRSRTRRGFTLLEILAVILVLALAAAVIVPGAASLFRPSEHDRIRHTLMRADGEARATARRVGQAELSVDSHAGTLTPLGVGESPESVDAYQLPGHVSAFVGDARTSVLRYRGWTGGEDAEIVVRLGGSAYHFLLNGATGWISSADTGAQR